jgi:cytochrome oxidase Cu insertion factor (SCO1/SenC/PrrC family)
MMQNAQVISVMLVTVCLLTAGCLAEEKSPFYGEEIKPAVGVEDFILLDENGEPYALSQLEGKVIVIAFLFTRCPDICPIVSANLHYVSEQLGDAYGEDVAILSITVDPWTDNSNLLKQYSDERGFHWPHLTGSLEELQPVWINFDVGLTTYDSDQDEDGVADGFDRCADTPEGEEVDHDGCGVDTQQSEDTTVTVKHHPLSYWIDHTTGTIIVDKDFNQRVWWGDSDWNAEMVLEDIKYLLEE